MNDTTTSTFSGLAPGWQLSNGTRGTWDIIWTSLQTLALCAWVSVCPNAPSPKNGRWHIFRDKFFFILLTLLGPDIVFLLALGQWQSARHSVVQFRRSSYKNWTIVHGFFADMGGLHVKPKEWPSFPVNAKQFHYLLERGYIDYPEISQESLEALGKSDSVAKFITLVQATCFLISTITRLAQGLAISTLELTVLANIFCMFLTYLCWWKKPADLMTTMCLPLKTDMNTIIMEAGPNATEYRETPLDFVSRDNWDINLLWNYYVNILTHLGLLEVFGRQKHRPAQRLSSFNFPRPPSMAWGVPIAVIGLVYASIFLVAWNFLFPSYAEMWLWRAVTLAQVAICTTVAIIQGLILDPEGHSVRVPHDVEKNLDKCATTTHRFTHMHRLRELWNKPCNNELTGNFPSLNVPLRSILIMSPICATYVVCRWIVLTMDVVGLRALPASAFQTVDWSRYLPWL